MSNDSPGGVNLSKLTLTKAAPIISLTKQGAATGMLRVNLNWNSRPPGAAPARGLFRRAAPQAEAIDLDLACLWEMADGRKGVVQALGNAFSINDSQGKRIVWLDGDDRSGDNDAGENIFIDLSALALIRRIVIFTFIYEGAANWAAADAVVTLFPVSGPQIEVRLDEVDSRASMCSIALLENVNGELSVRREVRYVDGHAALDAMYGWGLNWKPGRK